MIKSENGEATIKGSGWDVLVDFFGGICSCDRNAFK